MGNTQLATMIRLYQRLLEAAIREVETQLPEELFTSEVIKPPLREEYETREAPCMDPLYILLDQMIGDILILQEASAAS